MFFVIKKKTIICFVCILLLFCVVGVYFGVKSVVAKPNLSPVVVIDVGHGGFDVK